MIGSRTEASWSTVRCVTEPGADGIDFGDLPEILARVASEQDQLDQDVDNEIAVRPVYGGYCPHKRANINHGMRQLVCRDCEADLDPFDFLHRLTQEADRWRQARIHAQQRARAAEDRLQEILRLERNARARLKRIEGKSSNG